MSALRRLILLFGLLPALALADIKMGSILKRWEKTPGEPRVSPPRELATAVSRMGNLEMRLVEGGYYRMANGGRVYPIVRLVFKNLDGRKNFHENVSVELFESGMRTPISRSRTFLSLKPGHELERRYGNPRGVSYPSIEEAPALELRVRSGKKLSPPLALPSQELREEPVPPAGTALKVGRVVDGDTLELAGGPRVRLLGVDAPELHAEDPRREDYAWQARAYAVACLEGETVRLEYEGEPKDNYLRLLAWVWLDDGTLFNKELLRLGYARVYDRGHFALKDELLGVEYAARRAGWGLWAAN